ncbi:MAG: phage tail tube protein [Pseudomonadota bacterium]
MANPNQVVGEARITCSSLGVLPTDGQTTLDVGGPMRTSVKGDHDASAFSQTTEAAKLDVSLLLKHSVSLAAIRAIDNDTITIEFDTGRTFVMRNAYSADVPSATTSDGKGKVVFQSGPAEEIA